MLFRYAKIIDIQIKSAGERIRLMKIHLVLICMMALLTGFGFAMAGQPDVVSEKGRSLFNDPRLGTTGRSCNDCHPHGKGAEKAASKSDDDIARIVNVCITQSIRGKALDANSVEMRSLVSYIRSLGGEAKPAAPKAPAGC